MNFVGALFCALYIQIPFFTSPRCVVWFTIRYRMQLWEQPHSWNKAFLPFNAIVSLVFVFWVWMWSLSCALIFVSTPHFCVVLNVFIFRHVCLLILTSKTCQLWNSFIILLLYKKKFFLVQFLKGSKTGGISTFQCLSNLCVTYICVRYTCGLGISWWKHF